MVIGAPSDLGIKVGGMWSDGHKLPSLPLKTKQTGTKVGAGEWL